MKDLLYALVSLVLGLVGVPFALASVAACLIVFVIVIGVGLPIAIALGVLALPVYILYEVREWLA